MTSTPRVGKPERQDGVDPTLKKGQLVTDHTEKSATAPDASTKLALERTLLSYERTMLSWIRTATSLITFGFAIYSFHRIATGGVEQNGRFFGPHEFGLLMVSIGLVSLMSCR